MKKKAVSSSSWCPRHARLLPGMPAALEENKRTAAAAVWSTDTQKDAQTPLPSAARRTKQQRSGAVVRLCRPKTVPGAPGRRAAACTNHRSPGWNVSQRRASQGEGAGEWVRGGPLMVSHTGASICIFKFDRKCFIAFYWIYVYVCTAIRDSPE